jgi:hypothetical protein
VPGKTRDVPMNSLRWTARAFRGRLDVSYTQDVMTDASVTASRLSPAHQGGNSLGQSRAALSEVQICGIPKASLLEVASTT